MGQNKLLVETIVCLQGRHSDLPESEWVCRCPVISQHRSDFVVSPLTFYRNSKQHRFAAASSSSYRN